MVSPLAPIGPAGAGVPSVGGTDCGGAVPTCCVSPGSAKLEVAVTGTRLKPISAAATMASRRMLHMAALLRLRPARTTIKPPFRIHSIQLAAQFYCLPGSIVVHLLLFISLATSCLS